MHLNPNTTFFSQTNAFENVGHFVQVLTLKHRETHVCVVSTVATDALVLKHQAISIHNADLTFILFDQFHIKKYCT